MSLCLYLFIFTVFSLHFIFAHRCDRVGDLGSCEGYDDVTQRGHTKTRFILIKPLLFFTKTILNQDNYSSIYCSCIIGIKISVVDDYILY